MIGDRQSVLYLFDQFVLLSGSGSSGTMYYLALYKEPIMSLYPCCLNFTTTCYYLMSSRDSLHDHGG